MNKINLKEKLTLINDHWNPRIVAELNGQYVKLVKFKGPFTWHHHEQEDEMFLVVKGRFRMDYREDGTAAATETTEIHTSKRSSARHLPLCWFRSLQGGGAGTDRRDRFVDDLCQEIKLQRPAPLGTRPVEACNWAIAER